MKRVLSFYCEDCNENFEVEFPEFGKEYFKAIADMHGWKATCPYCGKTCISGKDKFIDIPDKE
nr:MAG TPA: DNA-directed RNA polymerase [Caudoviricetes sp.]